MKVAPGVVAKQPKTFSNVTSSVYQFVPRPEDNGKRLTCKSVNAALPNVTLEADMLLKVHCKLILAL